MGSAVFDSRLRDDFRYCQNIANRHYENFSVVSTFIPKDLRPHFSVVYAFCRGVDDLGDEYVGNRLQALKEWRRELDAAFTGTPNHPVFRALSDTVHRFDLDKNEFEKLIQANEMDQDGRSFQTIEDTLNYCRHSADPVGRLVLGLFGIVDNTSYELSDATCTGLQLVNFLQDTALDLKRGRAYWPEEDLARFGLSQQALTEYAVHGSPRLEPEMISAWGAFEANRIQAYFAKGSELENRVPRRLAMQLKAYRLGGEAVSEAMRHQNYNPFRGRPKVTRAQKSAIMLRVAAGSLSPQADKNASKDAISSGTKKSGNETDQRGGSTTSRPLDEKAEFDTKKRIAESYEACSKRVKGAGSSFYYGMRMLPSQKRAAIFAIYAWSRICDDAVDDYMGSEALHQLAKAEDLYTQAKEEGWESSPDLVSVALGDAIRRYNLSDEAFKALVHGMKADLEPHTYETFEELEAYCLDVAGAVGILCVEIFGFTDSRARELAAKLGIAMQLTNIVRDIKEDSERGRCYIPKEDLDRFKVSVDQVLSCSAYSPEIAKLLEFEVERAERYYQDAFELLKMVEPDAVRCLKLLYGVYYRILQKIRQSEFDVWKSRARVGKVEALKIMGGTFWPSKA